MSKTTKLIGNFIPDAQAIFRRFPLAILMALLLTTIVIVRANTRGNNWDIIYDGLASGAVLAGYMSIILTLFGEGRGKTVSILTKILVAGGALALSFFYKQFTFIPLMAIGAAILLLGSAPFWRQKRDNVAVWNFTHNLWIAVVFTAVGSLIYFMGLIAIFSALESLFSVNILDVIKNWLLPIGFTFLAPLAWLSMLGRHDDKEEHDSLRNPSFISRAVGFLGTWIFAPLTLIFAVVLVAYGLKIIATGELPKATIAQLVTPFLIVGTLTWLILDPPFIQNKRLARWFSIAWFPLMIPASLLLAVAVFVRVHEYGWTIERYLLMLASVWGLGISLWFTFGGEKRRDIRIIPGFAALLLAIGSIGPWGADGFSAINQTARLKAALVSSDMLTDAGTLKTVDAIKWDNEAGVKALGALEYLVVHEKIKRIKKFIDPSETFNAMDVADGGNPSDHIPEHPRPILERFAVDTVNFRSNYYDDSNRHRYYNDRDEPIDVKGYDFISTVRYVSFNTPHSDPHIDYGQKTEIGSYSIITERTDLIVKDDKVELARKDVTTWLKSFPVDASGNILLKPRLVLYENGVTKIVLHFIEANYSDADVLNNFGSAEYIVLAKGVE
ncbi:MAG: DUF4153 domain-containing protein [Robiginitomaculum sp.]